MNERVKDLIPEWKGKKPGTDLRICLRFGGHSKRMSGRCCGRCLRAPAYSMQLKPIRIRRIIEALLPLVKGFEVASIGELLKIREVSESVPILFGGPGKKDDELEQSYSK